MFQKSLFQKVDNSNELFKQYTWGRWEWEQFFNKLKGNYNTSTEQWNKLTRKELYDWILKEVDNYVSIQTETRNEKLKNKEEFDIANQNKNKYLKWNNEEFEVEYASLRDL
jgi:hypothetical protein